MVYAVRQKDRYVYGVRQKQNVIYLPNFMPTVACM